LTSVADDQATATLIAFVAAGMGVALVPEPVRSPALAGVAFRSLTDVNHQTELVLATRSEELPATVSQVVDLLEATTAGRDSDAVGGGHPLLTAQRAGGPAPL
jgi:DNA-binding transcriptional LysR family regulator